MVAKGREGIRTPGTREGAPVFKTGAIDHSATLPGTKEQGKDGIRTHGTHFEGALL